MKAPVRSTRLGFPLPRWTALLSKSNQISIAAFASLSHLVFDPYPDPVMSGKEGARIFVGGLSWETTERELGAAFSRFGKVLDSQIMVERDTGRPRGFGFVTFADRRAMEDAINEMHNKELNGRQISVNKAEPRLGSDDPGYGYGGGGYSSGSRGGYRGGSDDLPPGGQSDCFKCGRPGHWARECPSSGAGGGKFSSRPRIGRGGGASRDRFGGSDRHVDDRYDGGRYGDRTRLDGRDSSRYSGGGRDRYASDHYPSAGDRFSGNRYGSGPDRSLQDGYSKERSFDRDGGSRGGGDRYGTGGAARYEGGGGGGGGGSGYRERPGPYDRPSKGGRPSYDDRY